MTYRAVIGREAEKALDRLDRPTERRIRDRIVHLSENPYDPRLSAPLVQRPGIRKSRVGGWRILFTVDRETVVIYVLSIDTRGQVYQHS